MENAVCGNRMLPEIPAIASSGVMPTAFSSAYAVCVEGFQASVSVVLLASAPSASAHLTSNFTYVPVSDALPSAVHRCAQNVEMDGRYRRSSAVNGRSAIASPITSSPPAGFPALVAIRTRSFKPEM